MKKLAFVLIVLLLTFQGVFALEIVYPKKNLVVINAKSTFFIGSARTDIPLKINGQNVEVHPSGGFAYVVNLNDGKNIFLIEIGRAHV